MEDRILLVDDSADSRTILSALLEAAGYQTIEACDGEHGLKAVQDVKPSLILLDINMPGLDGFEVCKRLKSDTNCADIPIIFLTAQTDVENKVKALALGAADYVTKPYERPEVLARVQNQLKIRYLMQELWRTNQELSKKQAHIDEDLIAAQEIQRALLPKKDISHTHLDLAWYFKPCQSIGGDMLNFFSLNESLDAMYILDVSGHGVPAALLTMSMSQTIQHEKESYLHNQSNDRVCMPCKMLELLDLEYPFERFAKYASLVYIVLDATNKQITYSNAGHPSPILLRKDASVEFLNMGGPILGMGPELASFEQGQLYINPGDKIILYTDGVTECQDNQGNQFAEKGLVKLLQNCAGQSINQCIESVVSEIKAINRDSQFADDVSLLGIEFKGS